jgi:hypothetical protein
MSFIDRLKQRARQFATGVQEKAGDIVERKQQIKTPDILRPIAGRYLFKREPKEQPMVFPVGERMTPQQKRVAEKKIREIAEGGRELEAIGLPRTRREWLIPREGPEKRLKEVFAPILLKPFTERIEDRKKVLIEAGVEPEKAERVAIRREIDRRPFQVILPEKELTPQQMGRLQRHEAWQAGMGALELPIPLPIGKIGRVGKKAVVKPAVKKATEEILDIPLKRITDNIRPQETIPARQVGDKISDLADKTIRPTRIPRVEIKDQVKPKVSDSLQEVYTKKGLESNAAREMAEAELRLDPTNPDPKQYADYLKFQRGAQGLFTSFKEFVVSDWQRVRELEKITLKNPKFKIGDNLLPSERKTLFAGRRGARLEAAQTEIANIDKDFLATAQRLGVQEELLRRDVDRYLIARHTPERNAVIGPRATGLSNNEAGAIIREIENSPHFADVKRMGDNLQGLNNKILDTLYADGRSEGVITKELYDLLRQRYKNHVPLQRVFEKTEDIETILSGRGFDVKRIGIRRAVGSEREVADITTNIFNNYVEAIHLVEKNIVDNETLRFVREFIDAYPKQDLFEIVKPRAIGKDFNDRIILQHINDPSVLHLREAGKARFIRIKDPRLATAFKGINREQLPIVARAINTFTRLMSSLATRFNPEFAFTNKLRDIQEAVVYTSSQSKLGFKGAAKIAARDPVSMKEVTEAILGKNTEGARLYNQMVMDGGTTGGMALATRDSVEMSIDSIRKLNRSNPRKAARAIVKVIEDWNRVFEDSTRLSTYKEALKRGLTRDQAAVQAKRVTIDFNEFGTGGPMINALYMFANASIQGSAKMLRAMRNPRVAIATASVVGTSVFAANNWNDRIDPDWRNKVSKWDRLNGLPMVLPSNDEKFNYITIPVSWGIKPIKVSMDALYDLSEGVDRDIGEVADTIFTAIVEGYNPMGGTDFLSAVTPTILDIPADISRNRAWTGSKIKPDWDRYAPQSSVFFNDLKNTAEGQFFIDIARRASDITGGRIEVSPADLTYAYNQIISGAGRFVSKTINTIRAIGVGEELEVRQMPFISRFLRAVPTERIGAGGEEAREIRKILTEQSRVRIKLQNEAEAMFEAMKKMPIPQRKETYLKLKEENPVLLERINRVADEEERGLTYTDRLILNLGVENWERARYLKAQFNKLETTEERKELYLELKRKRILTDEVSRQIEALMAGQETQ